MQRSVRAQGRGCSGIVGGCVCVCLCAGGVNCMFGATVATFGGGGGGALKRERCGTRDCECDAERNVFDNQQKITVHQQVCW